MSGPAVLTASASRMLPTVRSTGYTVRHAPLHSYKQAMQLSAARKHACGHVHDKDFARFFQKPYRVLRTAACIPCSVPQGQVVIPTMFTAVPGIHVRSAASRSNSIGCSCRGRGRCVGALQPLLRSHSHVLGSTGVGARLLRPMFQQPRFTE